MYGVQYSVNFPSGYSKIEFQLLYTNPNPTSTISEGTNLTLNDTVQEGDILYFTQGKPVGSTSDY